MVQGPAIKCNIVLHCTGRVGVPDYDRYLSSLEDPEMVDYGSSSENRDRCRQEAMDRGLVDPDCKVDAAPAQICLDTDAGPSGAVPGTTTGTIVTVGVGAAGDFPQTFHGNEGAGGDSAESLEQWPYISE